MLGFKVRSTARLAFIAVAILAVSTNVVRASDDDDETVEEDEEVEIDPKALRGVPRSGKRMADEEGTVLLKCIYNATETPIEWFQVSAAEEETKLSEGITFDREKGISVLTVPKEQVVVGNYRCRASDDSSATFEVVPFFKLHHFPTSTKVDQAEDLKLKCRLRTGSQDSGDPTFAWFTKDETDPDGEGVKISVNMTDLVDGEPHIRMTETKDEETGMTMSVLKIEDARYDDRAIYQCIATNEQGQTQMTQTLVRVKDKYAALYPFAGIVAEVIVLCLVIFLCEKRRGGKEAEEEAEEDNGYNGVQAGGNARRRN